jgi:hypothetical protein
MLDKDSASAPELQHSDTPEADTEVGSAGRTNLPTEDDRIRQGREARARVRGTDSFEDWLLWGEAIAIGRSRVERETGASQGYRFNRGMGDWLRRNNLDGLAKSVRSELLECVRNREAVLAYLNGLEDRDRFRLRHPSNILRAWKRSTGQLSARQPSKSQDLTEALRSVGFETFLEKTMPPEWREQLEDRVERQTKALNLEKTHDKALSRHLVELCRLALEGKDLSAVARKLSSAVINEGRNPQDLAVYLHRSPHRKIKLAA